MGTKQSNSRLLAESHNFSGSLSAEPDEIILPGWLNAAKGTKSYGRILRILDLIHLAEENLEHILKRRAHIHVGPGKPPKEYLKLCRTSRQIHGELSLALTRYTFDLRLTSVVYGQEWLFSIYCNLRKDEFAWEAPYAYKPLPGQTILTFPTFRVSEGDAVLALLRLTEKRLLGRVRLCAMCSSCWFYAKHSNYRFCSKQCREKHFTSGDDYRTKKASQMRVYRSKQKLKEEAEEHSFRTSNKTSFAENRSARRTDVATPARR